MPAIVLKVLKYWKPLALGLAFIGAFFAGVRYESATCELEKQEIIAEYTQMIQDEVDRRYDISVDYEERLAILRSQTREVIKEVEVEVVKPIYKDCKVPESGINLLNDTINKLNKSRTE